MTELIITLSLFRPDVLSHFRLIWFNLMSIYYELFLLHFRDIESEIFYVYKPLCIRNFYDAHKVSISNGEHVSVTYLRGFL